MPPLSRRLRLRYSSPMRRAVLLAVPIALTACVAPRSSSPPFATAPQPAASAAAQPQPPEARERWQPRDVETNARTVAGQDYVVQPGDALSRIAERTGASTRAIANANGLSPPYVIFPQQRLRIPGGRYHRVNRGETGIAIALAYRVAWDRIVAANNLQPPYLLRVGERLLLPDGAPPQQVAETAPATPDTSPPDTAPPADVPLSQQAAFDIDIDDIITGGEPAVADASAPQAAASELPPPAPFDGRFIWPVEGRLLSGYGAKAGGLYNDGINIKADTGTPVRAAGTGTVIYAGNGVEGWGNLVLLKHDDEWVSAYAHADAFYVERGDRVGRGEVIAEVGQTGSVTEPQLHFELRRGRKAVDPRGYLPAG
jgi:murein DD-endopeptidase MepM/ murein hydrolase activator NlpD|tara:strand:+ start:27948 stop:29057 length:1110 start_codon:yes stop_codon:yes gene_type:complete